MRPDPVNAIISAVDSQLGWECKMGVCRTFYCVNSVPDLSFMYQHEMLTIALLVLDGIIQIFTERMAIKRALSVHTKG